MIRRSTWVVVFVFAALAGLAWVIQRQTASSELVNTPTPAPGYLLQLGEGDILHLRIEARDGELVELRHEVDGWALVVPEAEATDQGRVISTLSQSTKLPIMDRLEDPPALEDLGLEPPALVVTFDLLDGTQKVLEVGEKTPTGSGYYARLRGEPAVILNPGVVQSLLGLLDEPPLATPTPVEVDEESTREP